jgi:flagellar biogenesis protein FliO
MATDRASEAPSTGARQATYISAAESGSPQFRAAAESKQPLTGAKASPNQAEPMPFSGAAHDPSDTAVLHGRHAPGTPSAIPAVLSMFASLAVVLGLFLGVMWFLRRGLPKGTRILSSDVIEVLGRAPLAGRQQMHLIRFGNRLLLISVSPGGAETLAEINEPAEVDRLAGICQQSHKASATAAFSQIFRQLSEARGGKTKEPVARVDEVVANASLAGRRTVLERRVEDDDA